LENNFREQLSDLLDVCFSVPAGQHFFDDFPVWDPSFCAKGVRYFEAKHPVSQELMGACGARTLDLKINPSAHGGGALRVKVAILGAVCCHPNFRKQGIASRLVQEATEWAKFEGAAAAFLWGAQQTLYERQGYRFMGAQMRVPLGTLGLSPWDLTESDPVRHGWTDSLFDLLMPRPDGLVLEKNDLNWYAAHRHVEWYYLGNPQLPTAYAAVGRGIDLKDHVHEWGGSPEDLRTLFRAILKRHPKAILLGSPQRLQGLSLDLRAGINEFLCQAKILDSADPLGVSTGSNQGLWLWGLDAS
jgi:GNAT superfamily N-acetyltransferase